MHINFVINKIVLESDDCLFKLINSLVELDSKKAQIFLIFKKEFSIFIELSNSGIIIYSEKDKPIKSDIENLLHDLKIEINKIKLMNGITKKQIKFPPDYFNFPVFDYLNGVWYNANAE